MTEESLDNFGIDIIRRNAGVCLVCFEDTNKHGGLHIGSFFTSYSVDLLICRLACL